MTHLCPYLHDQSKNACASCLVVRIPAFQAGGPGSNPGWRKKPRQTPRKGGRGIRLCCLVLNCKAWQRWDLNLRPSALLPVASALHHSDGPHRHSSKEMESFGTTLRRKPFVENWELMRRKEDTHAPESYYSGRGRRTRVLGGIPRGKTARLGPWGIPRTHVFYLYFSKCKKKTKLASGLYYSAREMATTQPNLGR